MGLVGPVGRHFKQVTIHPDEFTQGLTRWYGFEAMFTTPQSAAVLLAAAPDSYRRAIIVERILQMIRFDVGGVAAQEVLDPNHWAIHQMLTGEMNDRDYESALAFAEVLIPSKKDRLKRNQLISQQSQEAVCFLQKYRMHLDMVANELLAKTTIEGDELCELIDRIPWLDAPTISRALSDILELRHFGVRAA